MTAKSGVPAVAVPAQYPCALCPDVAQYGNWPRCLRGGELDKKVGFADPISTRGAGKPSCRLRCKCVQGMDNAASSSCIRVAACPLMTAIKGGTDHALADCINQSALDPPREHKTMKSLIKTTAMHTATALLLGGLLTSACAVEDGSIVDAQTDGGKADGWETVGHYYLQSMANGRLVSAIDLKFSDRSITIENQLNQDFVDSEIGIKEISGTKHLILSDTCTITVKPITAGAEIKQIGCRDFVTTSINGSYKRLIEAPHLNNFWHSKNGETVRSDYNDATQAVTLSYFAAAPQREIRSLTFAALDSQDPDWEKYGNSLVNDEGSCRRGVTFGGGERLGLWSTDQCSAAQRLDGDFEPEPAQGAAGYFVKDFWTFTRHDGATLRVLDKRTWNGALGDGDVELYLHAAADSALWVDDGKEVGGKMSRQVAADCAVSFLFDWSNRKMVVSQTGACTGYARGGTTFAGTYTL